MQKTPKIMNMIQFVLSILLTTLMTSLLVSEFCFAQEKNNEAGKFFSEATLSTNYIVKGLTQTLGDPVFQGGMGYNFGMFRGGLFASNVRFPTENEHLQLKPYLQFVVDFTPDYIMYVGYEMSNYYKSGDRNFTETSIGMSVYGYKLMFLQSTNFEATQEASSHIAFSKTFDIPWSLKLEASLQSNSPQAVDTYKSYLDLGLKVRYDYQNMEVFSKLTGTSNSSQFSDKRGDYNIYVGVSARL